MAIGNIMILDSATTTAHKTGNNNDEHKLKRLFGIWY